MVIERFVQQLVVKNKRSFLKRYDVLVIHHVSGGAASVATVFLDTMVGRWG